VNVKTKVLHIITRLDPGGSSTNTLETVARLDSNKYETFLISGKTNDALSEVQHFIGKRKINCIFIDELRRSINPWYDFLAFIKIWKLLKKSQYDIVHTHSSKAGIIGRWAAWLAHVKCIVHTPHGNIFYGYFNKGITKIFVFLEQITAKITHRIITLTEKGKEEHVQMNVAREDKFVPIYSGIDIKKFENRHQDVNDKRKELKLSEENIIFGAVARLDPVKGNTYLVEAMEEVVLKIPNAKLVIVGDGTEKKEIESMIQRLQLSDAVVLTGFRKDVPALLKIFDIFILASLNEGMGRVILEAMASGKPVIATQTGGIPELVQEGQSGLLVPIADAKALSEAMIHLAENPKMMSTFGETGKKLVKDIFSLDKMVTKIDDLYQEIMSV